jgi:SAM-dependent methyltransferase
VIHYNYLLKFFKHKNYLKIDNKPVFEIHSPIDDIIFKKMLGVWNTFSIANGFDGIHIIACNVTYSTIVVDKYIYNSVALNQPMYKNSEYFQDHCDADNNILFFNSKKYIDTTWENTLLTYDSDLIMQAYCSFDNCVRLLQNMATRSIFINDDFHMLMNKMLSLYKKRPSETKIFLINAWNEWGENMSIEPSNEQGFKYLEIIKDSLIKNFCPASHKFSEIYDKNLWHCGSGEGSLPSYTISYRHFLEKFLREYNIKSVIDIGCGDWQFSKFIDWSNYNYIGLDCVQSVIDTNNSKYGKENIKFAYCDVFNNADTVPNNCDVIILKDVLIHWPNEYIRTFLPILKQKCKYLLTINTNGQTVDDYNINLGDFRRLSCNMKPLNEFNFELLFTFGDPNHYKEVLLLR